MKIAILAGGNSAEREVSLKSGYAVEKALIRRGHDVEFIDTKSSESSEILTAGQIETIKSCETTFVSLHGGEGENGEIAALLTSENIKNNSSSPAACYVSYDKNVAKKLLASGKIKTPEWEYINELPFALKDKKKLYINRICKHIKLKFPVVIKPAKSGSSIGIMFANNQKELKQALKKSLICDMGLIVEEKIKGIELTVGVLNGKALEVTEIELKNGFYDYKNKYTYGLCNELTPANISENERNMAKSIALKAHKVLSMGKFSRTDLILDENKNMYVLEVNAIPGMTDTSLLPMGAKAIGMNFDELCENMIEK